MHIGSTQIGLTVMVIGMAVFVIVTGKAKPRFPRIIVGCLYAALTVELFDLTGATILMSIPTGLFMVAFLGWSTHFYHSKQPAKPKRVDSPKPEPQASIHDLFDFEPVREGGD